MSTGLREQFPLFAERVDSSLARKGVPAKLYGADLLELLLGFAVEYLQGCLEVKSYRRIASDMKSVSRLQRFFLKRRIARKVFRGQANFDANQGDEIIDSLIEACSETEDDELAAIVRAVSDAAVPDPNPDPFIVKFPTL